jgi:peptidoglycan/xylan/chitin deacetylase (PgdA/CDA1 family)
MQYEFYKKKVSNGNYILIKTEDHSPLENFGDDNWTPTKAQEIIDGVEESRTKSKDGPYEWANEDVELQANENGVWLYDWLADRGGVTNPEKLNLFLTHDEFIQFMKDFKKFVEDN